MLPIFMPIRPQCSHWPNGYGGGRCKEQAEVWVIDPDGKQVAGGWACRPHGEATVKEYAEKLGEQWTLVDITTEMPEC